jgi:hypothetical protein
MSVKSTGGGIKERHLTALSRRVMPDKEGIEKLRQRFVKDSQLIQIILSPYSA